jgi:hypothetical protein
MAEKERMTDFRPEDRRLIAALIIASSGWVLHLNVSYILVPESCSNGSKMMLHALTAICIAFTAIAAAMAWRLRTTAREHVQWMATMTVAFSVGLALVIVAQEIPNLILRSCD